MNYLLMILTLFIFTVQLISFMLFNNYYRKTISCYYIYSILYFIVTIVILLIVNGGIGSINFTTVIFGIIFGFVFVFTMQFNITAMSIGPIGFSTLIFSLNLIMPMIAGLLFYNETISLVQIIGFLLLFVTFYLGSTSSENGNKRMSLKWLMFALLAFLGGGILGILIKVHQSMYPGQYMISYLVVGFISAIIVASILTITRKIKYKENIGNLINKNVILLVLAAGLTTAFGNLLMMKLISLLPAVVLFPVVNGGQIVTMTIASVLIFKEKLNSRSKMGIIFGITAICLISL